MSFTNFKPTKEVLYPPKAITTTEELLTYKGQMICEASRHFRKATELGFLREVGENKYYGKSYVFRYFKVRGKDYRLHSYSLMDHHLGPVEQNYNDWFLFTSLEAATAFALS